MINPNVSFFPSYEQIMFSEHFKGKQKENSAKMVDIVKRDQYTKNIRMDALFHLL